MIVRPRIAGLGVHALVPLLARIDARIAERRRALSDNRVGSGRGVPSLRAALPGTAPHPLSADTGTATAAPPLSRDPSQ